VTSGDPQETPMSDPHQPGTPEGADQGGIDRRSALAEVLGKEIWPADRDQLVARAEEENAPGLVLSDLRGLPAGQEFANVQDVARALGLHTDEQRF
jgi:hypothetical protein